MADAQMKNAFFLGLDSSTQSLKAVLIDSSFRVQGETAVNFDRDLPRFGTEGGVHRHADGLTVTSPALMWVAALDLLLDRMRDGRWPLDRVAAVSGSGQQHGSVWLVRGARQVLNRLDPGLPLEKQLEGIFALRDSPVWMDSSTTAECREREEKMGGAQRVADITGSRAYERFTGNQIAKIFKRQPDVYGKTERIALVSSFMASLLTGDYAPIDMSDGSGMNLLDIRRRAWDRLAMDVTAPNLAEKLGEPSPSHAVVGRIHGRYVKAYSFSPNCFVIAFSGDNPCSLAGLRLQKVNDAAISMGTSDTMFASIETPRPSGEEGHIFVNPVDPEAYMAMLCIKNGSLTREYVRDMAASGSWDEFNRKLESTPPGNNGNIGFYIREPEITPPILKTGIYRFDGAGRSVEAFDPAAETRAVVEGQFLAMRLHARKIGISAEKILATGGASSNRSILKVMADVFGVPVYVAEQANSAALGAACRAFHGWLCAMKGSFVPFAAAMEGAPEFQMAFRPEPAAQRTYDAMLERYEELEKRIPKK